MYENVIQLFYLFVVRSSVLAKVKGSIMWITQNVSVSVNRLFNENVI